MLASLYMIMVFGAPLGVAAPDHVALISEFPTEIAQATPAPEQREAEFQADMEWWGRPHQFESGGFTPTKLVLEQCGDKSDFCVGYIFAVLDSLVARMIEEPGAKRICIPERVMLGRADPMVLISHAVRDKLSAIPKEIDKPAFEVMRDALFAAYPCG